MSITIQSPVALKTCPFCGGKAEMKLSNPLMHNAIRVECVVCRCTSSLFMEANTVAFNGTHSRYVTLEECIDKATENWNRRA